MIVFTNTIIYIGAFHFNHGTCTTKSVSQSGLERKALDSCGKGGKVEIPQAQPRKLDFLPAESKRLQRKGTVLVYNPPFVLNTKTNILSTPKTADHLRFTLVIGRFSLMVFYISIRYSPGNFSDGLDSFSWMLTVVT
jgi:hypothetical protein